MSEAAPPAPPALPTPSKRRAWLLAVRPPTLPAAVAPVLAGTGLAAWLADIGTFEAGRFFLALVGAVFIQIVVNFANDLSDFQRGADTPDRLGPPRAVAQGWLSQREMTIGIALATAAALIVGVVLTVLVGWQILLIGAASLIAAVTYTGGPLPYGYRALGDAVCFLFFGFVAVMGAGFVQVEALHWALAAASVPLGCTVTAILVVNNLRDLPTDRASGKRTLAVVLGDRATRWEFSLLIWGAFAAVVICAAASLFPLWTLLTLLALPFAVRLTREIMGGVSGAALNPLLKRTAQLHLLVGALFGLGGALAAVL